MLRKASWGVFCLVAMDPGPGVEAHSLGTDTPGETQTPHFTDEEPCPESGGRWHADNTPVYVGKGGPSELTVPQRHRVWDASK